MKKKLTQNNKQKHKLRIRLLYVCGVLSFFMVIACGLLVIMNLNNLGKMKASSTGAQGGGGNDLNNGEIISEFTWENNNVTSATLGPDAISGSKFAHTMAGGQSGSLGLSPGSKAKDIDLVIQAGEIFKQDGIDISIDYRRNELSGDFFTRGNGFNFGMEDGFVSICYSIENKTGKTDIVKEKTGYEIPIDPVFRTYRFMYSPATGKGELFVNNIIIWQHEGEKNSPLTWKQSDNIIIGRNMNGGGLDKAIFDNLIIRSTGSVAPLAESLLNFMLESRDGGGVKIHWSSSANDKVDYFTIERSLNGINFTNIANVDAKSDSSSDEEYIYTDQAPASSEMVYYRLRQTFKNGKFITHALSAIRFKTDKGFSIERINPTPFQKSCDISYYLPKSGKVWMQISDDTGTILSTSSFDAPRGKNVHVFRDNNGLSKGTYTFSLIFESKKISAKVVKG